MKLLAQKNVKYTLPEFFSKVINYDFISGIVLNILKTKDNVLVVVNLRSADENYLNTIYANEFLNLKGFEMTPLKEVINYLNRIGYKKKVILNIIPYLPVQLTEEENKRLFLEYLEYVKKIKEILKNNNLDMYIHSVSRSLIDLIKKENIKSKLGFAIVGIDLNYIDVDYYVFIVSTLNIPLLKQQLDNSKEIMVYVSTDYEISYLYDIFKGNKKTDLTKEIAKSIYLIGNYPEVLNETFLV